MPERRNLLIHRVEELLEIERRFNSKFGTNPVPAWLKFVTKDSHLVMGMVNAAYTAATGISVTAYMGRPDHAIWTPGEAESFGAADKHVLKTGTAHRIAEKATNPRTGKDQYWVGWKWPYVYQDKIIGIWGMAEPYPDYFWDTFGADILKALKDR